MFCIILHNSKRDCLLLLMSSHYCCLYHFAVNVGEDCPVFDGLFEFCQLSAGGSAGKLGENTWFKNH